ncbi:hypothetical protein L204_103468 [Cryptococcus depauperatus]
MRQPNRQTKLTANLNHSRRVCIDSSDDDNCEATFDSSQEGVNKQNLYFSYPLLGRPRISITKGDARRLESGDFLNDTLLEFGLQRIFDQVNEQIRDATSIFNSFFYSKLANTPKTNKSSSNGWPGYTSVKRWTKDVNIFNKRFIIIPINEHNHWYLAIIINSRGILKQSTLEAVSSPSVAISSTISKSPKSLLPLVADQNNLPDDQTPELVLNHQCHTYGSLNFSNVDSEERADLSSTSLSSASVKSDDLLDISDDSDDKMDVDDKETAQNSDRASNFIEEGLNDKLNEHHKEGHGDMKMFIPSDVEGNRPIIRYGGNKHKREIITIMDNSDKAVEFGERAGKRIKAHQNNNEERSTIDWEVDLHDGRAYIVTFDSLGGAHKTVGSNLSLWLKYEAKDKLGIDYDPVDAVYRVGHAPQQPNFVDCGLYVLHYTHQFLQHTDEILRFLQRKRPRRTTPAFPDWKAEMTASWRATDTKNIRNIWIRDMKNLSREWARLNTGFGKPNLTDKQYSKKVGNKNQNIDFQPNLNGHSRKTSTSNQSPRTSKYHS